MQPAASIENQPKIQSSETHRKNAHFGSMRNSASNSVLGALYTLGAGADAAPSALPLPLLLPLPLILPLTASHASMNSRSAAASSAALNEAVFSLDSDRTKHVRARKNIGTRD